MGKRKGKKGGNNGESVNKQKEEKMIAKKKIKKERWVAIDNVDKNLEKGWKVIKKNYRGDLVLMERSN